jgi:two-component system OmpR family sensor kinase
VRADGARARDTAGAGLGLALSRAIAESHGGSLQLLDQNGSGATFRLFLPKLSPAAQPSPGVPSTSG